MSHRSPDYTLSAPARQAFRRWWEALSGENANGQARADRAVLRRAHDLAAIESTPAYLRFYHDLADTTEGAGWPEWQRERIAALVGLAAHVRQRSEFTVPAAMSHRTEGSDRNPVSELRFARLLDSPDIEALFTGLRRLLPLIDYTVDVYSLADDVFGWGDFVKKQWAYRYDWPKRA